MTFVFLTQFWDIGRNFYSRDMKSAFYWCSGTCLGRKSEKRVNSMSFPGLRAKYLQMFGEKKLGELSKLLSACPVDFLEEKIIYLL